MKNNYRYSTNANKYDKFAKKKSMRKVISRIVIVIILLIVAVNGIWSFGYKIMEPLVNDRKVDVEHLYSNCAILVDINSNRVVAEHNSDKIIYPASLTKIMTAVLAIENENLNQKMKLSSSVFNSLYGTNASMAGFNVGEEVFLKDLLYGVLMPSGAECCIALAEKIANSEEAFVKMMNEKAREIGMKNTNFTNSTGLHDPNHYSTTKDIATLVKYALQYKEFRDAFSSSIHTTYPTNLNPNGITFQSTMFKHIYDNNVTGGKIVGGKTGYTNEAGLCLASLALINGKEYILVTTKAKGSHETAQFNIHDAFNVYNQIGQADLEK